VPPTRISGLSASPAHRLARRIPPIRRCVLPFTFSGGLRAVCAMRKAPGVPGTQSP